MFKSSSIFLVVVITVDMLNISQSLSNLTEQEAKMARQTELKSLIDFKPECQGAFREKNACRLISLGDHTLTIIHSINVCTDADNLVDKLSLPAIYYNGRDGEAHEAN